ncbi:c-type cytochrome [Solimonas fluminis]|nr:c-type cytochrome [Solimonas fluminis]
MTIDIDPKDVRPGPPPPIDILDKHSNRAFFIRFTLVVVLLHAVAGGLVLASRIVGQQEPDMEQQRELIARRIAPVGLVATSDQELAALTPVAAPAAPRSGPQVVAQVCGACHASGMLGAPKSHDKAAWAAREKAAGGPDGLLKSAIRGKGQMPPKGGDPSLGEQELRDAIAAMR